MKKFIFLLVVLTAFSKSLFAIEPKNCEQYQLSEPAKFRECLDEMMMNGDKAADSHKQRQGSK